MILTSRLTFGLLCFTAGGLASGLTVPQGTAPAPANSGGPYADFPGFRVDCDDWRTTRRPDAEYWESMAGTKMSMLDAMEAVLISTREDGKENVQIHTAKFVPSPRPTFEFELLVHDDETEETTRWLYTVGTASQRVRKFVRTYQYPGHPPVGDYVTSPSGLVYNDFREGTGETVTRDSEVVVHYVVSTLDGQVVWDTYNGRSPKTFVVKDAMTRGLREGLIGMKVGGKRKLIMSPELAFGAAGMEGYVPPNATVVFDVEVRKIN